MMGPLLGSPPPDPVPPDVPARYVELEVGLRRLLVRGGHITRAEVRGLLDQLAAAAA